MCSIKKLFCLFLLLGLFGCKEVSGDLLPSGKDHRLGEATTQSGPLQGLIATDSQGAQVKLQEAAAQAKGLVLYFTMWCPVCNSHTDHLLRVMPQFPQARLLLVDFVSGTIEGARQAQQASGYQKTQVLVDTDGSLTRAFSGTMSTTVVLNPAGQVLMQEDFKDGSRLLELLGNL